MAKAGTAATSEMLSSCYMWGVHVCVLFVCMRVHAHVHKCVHVCVHVCVCVCVHAHMHKGVHVCVCVCVSVVNTKSLNGNLQSHTYILCVYVVKGSWSNKEI